LRNLASTFRTIKVLERVSFGIALPSDQNNSQVKSRPIPGWLRPCPVASEILLQNLINRCSGDDKVKPEIVWQSSEIIQPWAPEVSLRSD
jgi:hypothetical protein